MPSEALRTAPLARSAENASLYVLEAAAEKPPFDPSDMFTTSGSKAAASSSAARTAESDIESSVSEATFIAAIWAWGAVPRTSPALAAAMPATCVP